MNHDESRRAIIDALGLSPHAGGKLLEALDARYAKKLTAQDVRDAMGAVAQRHGLRVDPLGPVLGSIHMVPEVVPVAPGETIRWGVLDSDGDWLEATSYYVLRATNEAIAAELNMRADRRTHTRLRYEARPVLVDGSPGPVPNVCTKCGVNFHDPAYATNGCFHTHYGEYTGFSTAVVDATSAKKVVEHCLGNDCADKAACECTCDRCNP